MATASYILEKEAKRPIGVYIIGQIGLWKEILDRPEFYYDEENPDYVIVGMDTDLTYHKLMVATRCIHRGAVFIGTNSDQNLPVGKELRPGNGSICAALEVASRAKAPFYRQAGSHYCQPRPWTWLGSRRKRPWIVGDNYPTDIMAGINSGVDTLLTLTGVTQKADLAGLTPPTYLVNDLDEFIL